MEPSFRAHVAVIVDWSFPIIVWLSITLLIVKIVGLAIEGRIANKAEIKYLLDALQKTFFQDIPEEDLYKNRVTLFRPSTSLFRRRQVLKLYVRAGTSYQKSSASFPIDDDAEESNQGVAGRAWFKNGIVSVLDLPAWPEGAKPEHDPDCKVYCQKGFISVGAAKMLQIKSRSISAAVIRTRTGRRCGVIVIDSRDPQGASLSTQRKSLINLWP